MLTPTEKLQLISDVYGVCYPNISSFYTDMIGVELAYVTQAILSDSKCELQIQSALIKLLQAEFAPVHKIWNFIYFEPTVECCLCGHDILLTDAEFSPILNGWIGKMCCNIYPKECIRCGLVSAECHCTSGPFSIIDGRMYDRTDRQKIILTQK